MVGSGDRHKETEEHESVDWGVNGCKFQRPGAK